MTAVPSIPLRSGGSIPQLGLGVFQVPDEQVADVVATALRAGYRSLDTAAGYGNERGVGRGIADAEIPRDELFVTTKLDNADHGFDAALRAFDACLRRLGLEHVDLFLIHWPLPALDRYVETWRALERIQADGRARAIGVSNFTRDQLDRLIADCTVVPAVNQIELHPRLPQRELRAFHAEHGIVTEAWSPLGKGELLEHPLIAEIAAAHGVAPAQALLRWHVQADVVAIPKTVSEARMRTNLDCFGFTLDAAQLAAIATLEDGHRLGPDPATFAG